MTEPYSGRPTSLNSGEAAWVEHPALTVKRAKEGVTLPQFSSFCQATFTKGTPCFIDVL